LPELEILLPDHTWYGVGRDNDLPAVATSGGFIVEFEEITDRIDYVFVGDEVKVRRYGVLSDPNWASLSRSYRSPAPTRFCVSKTIPICWFFCFMDFRVPITSFRAQSSSGDTCST
jgi:hypothetical protein